MLRKFLAGNFLYSLNGTHQFVIYTDDININTIKKSTGTVSDAREEVVQVKRRKMSVSVPVTSLECRTTSEHGDS
jgi:hypothetical protein